MNKPKWFSMASLWLPNEAWVFLAHCSLAVQSYPQDSLAHFFLYLKDFYPAFPMSEQMPKEAYYLD